MAVGFGVDTWCGDSRTTGRLARGRTLLALALYRRLITPRGTLTGSPEAEVYGFDVAGFVGRIGYERALGALPSMIAAELRKDDRVADVLVEVAQSIDGLGDISLTITIHVTPQDELADFALTLSTEAANDNALEIIGVLPEAA